MFVVTEEDVAALRAAFYQDGELSAVIEFRRRFPAIRDNAKCREHVRAVVGWKPPELPPAVPLGVTRLRPKGPEAEAEK